MNFELSEEHKMIRDAARDFAQNELLPGVIERDENQAFPHEQIKNGRTWVHGNDGISRIWWWWNGYCFICFGNGRNFKN